MSDEKTTFPTAYQGMHYTDALGQLALKRGVSRYFEIGVQAGRNLARIPCDTAIGVDPSYQLTQNVAHNKKKVILFQMTSDRYFSDVDTAAEARGTIDLAFLDGMHLFEYLLRDFYNTERICSPRSLIALHDCMPLSSGMAGRNEQQVAREVKGTNFERFWTGDVWKIVPILKKYRPDLKVVLLDCPPTGLVLISNLDPSSNFLSENYLEIVREFSFVPNDDENIISMYKENKILSSSALLDEFDHSLYLKI